MSFPEDDNKHWKVPAYIDEGLKWLETPFEKMELEKETIIAEEEE